MQEKHPQDIMREGGSNTWASCHSCANSLPPRITGNSSLHRLARARQLPVPGMATEALEVLGDQQDHACFGLDSLSPATFPQRFEVRRQHVNQTKIILEYWKYLAVIYIDTVQTHHLN